MHIIPILEHWETFERRTWNPGLKAVEMKFFYDESKIHFIESEILKNEGILEELGLI